MSNEAFERMKREVMAELYVGRRVFNQHTGCRGSIAQWPQSLNAMEDKLAVKWDHLEDVRIIDFESVGILYGDDKDAQALSTLRSHPGLKAALERRRTRLLGIGERWRARRAGVCRCVGVGGGVVEGRCQVNGWQFFVVLIFINQCHQRAQIDHLKSNVRSLESDVSTLRIRCRP